MKESDMEIKDYPLEPILDYQMNVVQAKAYKLLIIWLVQCRKVFPNIKLNDNRMPKGDPRKSYIWKVCYKCVRMLEGKIKDDDLKLYVTAQLQMMRNMTDGQAHANVTPEILTGQTAWARWCVWKKKFDACLKAKPVDKVESPPEPKILADIDRSKAFLERIFRRQPVFDDIKIAVEDRSMIRWAKLKKISPLYLMLSPWVKKLTGGTDPQRYFGVDTSMYKVTPGIESYFKKKFSYEFSILSGN